MTQEEFVKNVANTEILTDREVRTIFTVLAGGEPNVPMQFENQERGGSFQQVLFSSIADASKINISLPEGVVCNVKLQGLRANDTLELSEIYFLNPADFPYDVVRVGEETTWKIEKIPQFQLLSYPVYRAVFDSVVKTCHSQFGVSLKAYKYTGSAPTAYISGTQHNWQTVELNGKSLKMQLEIDSKYAMEASCIHSNAFTKFQARNKDLRSWAFLIGIKGRIVTN